VGLHISHDSHFSSATIGTTTHLTNLANPGNTANIIWKNIALTHQEPLEQIVKNYPNWPLYNYVILLSGLD